VADENWFPLSKGHSQVQALNPESEATNAYFLSENDSWTEIGAT
jgi:hypothetical protein